MQAEEMIDKGELDKALALLRNVQPEQSHFIESRKLMSEIYLNYRPDNEQYINCFTYVYILHVMHYLTDFVKPLEKLSIIIQFL
jgi:hypothetical protein